MGCVQTAQQSEPIKVPIRKYNIKSKTNCGEKLLRTKFIDNKGYTFCFVSQGSNLQRVPILNLDENLLMMRRKTTSENMGLPL
ncbi:hypothetical protein pb186bvf_011525 [Paramecium bursaria]